MMLQACLGVTVDGWTGAVSVTQPRLPIGIDRLEIEDLPLGAARVDIRFHQKDDQVEVLIVRKDT